MRPSTTFVSVWASPASKLSSVGTEVIMYVRARLSEPVDSSGASNSTAARPTPPSSSPTPDSTSERSRGSTCRHDGHQEAVQRVRRGVRDDDDSERYVWKMSGLRTLRRKGQLPLAGAGDGRAGAETYVS